MLNYALLGLSFGVIGECALLLCTYASCARLDVRSPLLAMVSASFAACGIGAALTLPQDRCCYWLWGSCLDRGSGRGIVPRLAPAVGAAIWRGATAASILRSAAAARRRSPRARSRDGTARRAALGRPPGWSGRGCLLGALTFLLVQEYCAHRSSSCCPRR